MRYELIGVVRLSKNWRGSIVRLDLDFHNVQLPGFDLAVVGEEVRLTQTVITWKAITILCEQIETPSLA